MPPQKTQGVILRKYLLRETSYILVVFTREFGKVKGVIKGIRKPYPQFAGNFEIFTLVDMLLYRGKKRPLELITQCEAVDFFLNIRKDIQRLTYANYYIELIEIVCEDLDPDPELFDLLVDGLRMLASGASAKRVTRIFEIKLLSLLGLRPETQFCVGCGKEEKETAFFDIKNGGIFCKGCAGKKNGLSLVSQGTCNFIRKIQESDMAKTCQIKVSKEVGEELEKLLKGFMAYNIGRPIKSLGFLAELEKQGVV